jgi:transposase
VLIFL